MPDPAELNPLAGLPSFFKPTDLDDPRVNPVVRQKIALAMMARQSRTPRNAGEGIKEIGEALGDRSIAQKLINDEITNDEKARAIGATIGGAPPPAPVVSDAGPAVAPPAAVASAPPPMGGGSGADTLIGSAGAPPADVVPPPAGPPPVQMAQAAPPPIRPAPQPPQVRAVPGAGTLPPYGYVAPKGDYLPSPPPVPMGPIETRTEQEIRKYPIWQQQQIRSQVPGLAQEQAIRAAKQKEQDAIWELKNKDIGERNKLHETQSVDAPERALKGREEEARVKLETRLGQPLKDFLTDFTPKHAGAVRQAGVLNSIHEVESAIKAGAITGYGANRRIDTEKLKAWLLKSGKSGDVAAASDELQAQLAATVPLALDVLQPGDKRVTEGDIAQAQAQSGRPEMMSKALLNLMRKAKEGVYERLDTFEELRDKKVGGHPLEDNFKVNVRPIAPDDKIKRLLDNRDSQQERTWFDEAYGRGASTYIINRARRSDEAARRRP